MSSIDALLLVASRLGPIVDDVVFVGGAVVGLLLTDPAAPAARITRDVDLIVEVINRSDYTRLEEELRARGFTEDLEDGVIRVGSSRPSRST